MQFQHSIAIQAPPQRVWDFLWDVERLARCIPGCEQVTTLEPHRRYTAVVADRVGPLKLKMPLDLTVQSSDEGSNLHVVGTGKDSALGSSVRLDIKTSLAAEGEGTRMLLDVDATVTGKIAGLGFGLFKRKFDDVMTKFGAQVKATIEAAPETAGAG